MTQPIIPLFPLPLVVFPGERRPLHIFEERYKIMMDHCRQAEDGPRFGIALIKDNKLYGAGCLVEITETLYTYPDGRLDIVTVGQQRFRILEVYSDRQAYYQAKIDYIDDEALPVDAELVQQALERRNDLDRLVGESAAFEPGDEAAAFVLAQREEVPVEDKQRLLEMTSETERLQTLIECFDRLIPALQQRHSERERLLQQRERIESNGHL